MIEMKLAQRQVSGPRSARVRTTRCCGSVSSPYGGSGWGGAVGDGQPPAHWPRPAPHRTGRHLGAQTRRLTSGSVATSGVQLFQAHRQLAPEVLPGHPGCHPAGPSCPRQEQSPSQRATSPADRESQTLSPDPRLTMPWRHDDDQPPGVNLVRLPGFDACPGQPGHREPPRRGRPAANQARCSGRRRAGRRPRWKRRGRSRPSRRTGRDCRRLAQCDARPGKQRARSGAAALTAIPAADCPRRAGVTRSPTPAAAR